MRRIIQSVPAGLLAAVLAAGCSASAPAPYRATVDTCYAFGVRALQRRITVTAVPRACHGLSHAQVNLAAARAVREVVGPRPKAAARRLANNDSAYLGHLISTVPPSAPASLAAGPAQSSTQSSTDRAASLAALAAWILTAAAGSYLLAGWLLHGGLRRRPSRAAGLPPVIIVGHFALAVAGLGVWIAFVVTDVVALAWTAAGLILPVAGLGMATLAAALPDPAPSTRPPTTRPTSTRPTSPGPTLATRIVQTAAPARVRMPVTVIAVHGILATATILLVLLAAIGAP
ncbi:MAG TPA: hypothetical protein VMV07_24530 [Streptosporangiaceae bacterium]|nr:hypothetical protein [Streptosporangiaceae bacterium]